MAPPLAFHIAPNPVAGAVARASQGAPWVKVCRPADIAIARLAGAANVYLRPYLSGDDGDCSDGVAWAREVGNAIEQTGGGWPDALGFRNECSATVQTAAQYLRYRDALRALGYRGMVALGSFSVGKPDWPDWGSLKAGLAGYAPDAIDLHEYWADRCGDNAPSYELRHVEAIRRGLLPATWPLIIGEINRDSPPGQGPGGWQGIITADQQTANLTTYRAGCAPSVMAAFVFVDGDTSGKWQSFATFGTPVEAAIRATWHDIPKGIPMLQGIDISSLQPGTDFAQVASTHQFAFIKATEGTGYRNPYFPHDWDASKAAGLVHGAYHFAQPAYNGPIAEADYFLAAVGELAPGDMLVLDLEVGAGDLSGWAFQWLQHVEQRVGFRPILYTYPSFITEHGLGTAPLATYPLWYASYQQQWPPVPGQWSSIAIWQHSDNATVPGVAGFVDESYTTLTLDQLRALGKQQEGPIVDTLTVLAVNRAKAANPAITPNLDSANFKAYKEMIRVWDGNGRPNYLDPGPWLRNAAATATDEYVPLDSGIILHSKQEGGQWVTYIAEAKERAGIFAAVGWGQAV